MFVLFVVILFISERKEIVFNINVGFYFDLIMLNEIVFFFDF